MIFWDARGGLKLLGRPFTAGSSNQCLEERGELLANEPTIAGYDLLKEPMVYTSIIPTLNESNVNAYYSHATAAIRSVDPNHIIFLEPASCMYTPNIMPDSKIVWEPHFYPLSFFPHYYSQNLTVLEADLAAQYQTFVVDAKSPMWVKNSAPP